MDLVLKYWPLIVVGLNLLMVWICWSLRQLAKDEVEKVSEKLSAADKAITQELAAADRAIKADVDALDTRVTRVEGSVDNIREDISQLPTKADIARVEGEISKVGQDAAAARGGIQRLESYWLQKGVKADA